MPLEFLELHNLRIYESAQLSPDPHLNLISGANASGKTTLLEAIHLLGTGRSFRTTQVEQLQRNTASDLSVLGQLRQNGDVSSVRLGFIHTETGRRASINGLEQRQVSGLAQYLPLQTISPDTHYEFQHSAKHRRGVLDWGLFHVEPEFPELWGRYQRILQQRNAALKHPGQSKARYVWDDDLVQVGEALNAKREDMTARLLSHYRACCQELLDSRHKVDLILDPGWDQKHDLVQNLRQDRARDIARGFTHSGPHRADLQIMLDTQASRLGASHGQYKILVIALRLAQIRFLVETRNRHCCLLIDDLAAELDRDHRARLTRVLATLPVQIFVTATDASQIEREFWPSHKKFHVEQGVVTEQP
jgi:DNA replication and repair protein RecF